MNNVNNKETSYCFIQLMKEQELGLFPNANYVSLVKEKNPKLYDTHTFFKN
jgi:hypothetical protein